MCHNVNSIQLDGIPRYELTKGKSQMKRCVNVTFLANGLWYGLANNIVEIVEIERKFLGQKDNAEDRNGNNKNQLSQESFWLR